MKNYGGGGHKSKDPNQPKKPLTGYFLFLADFRKRNTGVPNKEILRLGEYLSNVDGHTLFSSESINRLHIKLCRKKTNP